MDINDLVLSDKALYVIDNGEWMEAGYEAPGVEFLVTGMESEGARKLKKDKQAEMRIKCKGKPLTEDQYAEIAKEVLIEEVLKDWRGLKDGGKDLPYSKDLAREFIMSRGGEKFTGLILRAAQRLDNSANDFVETAGKN